MSFQSAVRKDKHCVYDAEVNFKKELKFNLNTDVKNETDEEIASLLKNIINKIFKSD